MDLNLQMMKSQMMNQMEKYNKMNKIQKSALKKLNNI